MAIVVVLIQLIIGFTVILRNIFWIYENLVIFERKNNIKK
jgi:hypothetical protein